MAFKKHGSYRNRTVCAEVVVIFLQIYTHRLGGDKVLTGDRTTSLMVLRRGFGSLAVLANVRLKGWWERGRFPDMLESARSGSDPRNELSVLRCNCTNSCPWKELSLKVTTLTEIMDTEHIFESFQGVFVLYQQYRNLLGRFQAITEMKIWDHFVENAGAFSFHTDDPFLTDETHFGPCHTNVTVLNSLTAKVQHYFILPFGAKSQTVLLQL